MKDTKVSYRITIEVEYEEDGRAQALDILKGECAKLDLTGGDKLKLSRQKQEIIRLPSPSMMPRLGGRNRLNG